MAPLAEVLFHKDLINSYFNVDNSGYILSECGTLPIAIESDCVGYVPPDASS